VVSLASLTDRRVRGWDSRFPVDVKASTRTLKIRARFSILLHSGME
jgi:hypothetical protein